MSPEAIIQGTPIWVWVLLVVLLSRGFKALDSATAPLSRLALLPLIFAGWGLVHMATNPFAGGAATVAWVACLLAGCACGAVIASRTRFIVDPAARTVMLPGSALPLVLIVATFAAKFWLGFETATATSAASLATYAVVDAAVSGLVAGVFGGRFICYCRAMAARRVVHAGS